MIFRNRFKSLKGNRYSDYVLKNEPKATPYYEALRESGKILPKTLFIRGGASGVHSRRLKALVDKALGKGFTVTMSYDWEGKFDDTDHISFLKDNTKEYYQALLSAEYIYAGTSLTANYNKREGQFLVADMAGRNRKNIDTRIAMDFMYPEADVIVPYDDAKREEVWKKLLDGKLKSRLPLKKSKPKILIMINTKYYRMFELAKQMLSEIDYEKYDVSVLIPKSGFNKYKTQLSLLDQRVHVLLYKGEPLCDGEEMKRYSFLKQEGRYLPEIKKTDSFLGKEVFEKEVKRVLRSQSFDQIYNLTFDSIQYKLFMFHAKGRKVVLNTGNYCSKDGMYMEALREDLRYMDIYDEIWFENDSKLEPAKAFSQKIIGKKGRLVPHLVAETDYEETGLIGKKFRSGDDEYFITDYFNGEFLDTTSLVSVLLPKEKYSYMVPGQIKNEDKDLLLNQIGQILKEKKILYVFDFHKLLSDADMAYLKYDGEVVKNESYTALNLLRPYLGEEIPMGSVCMSAEQPTIFADEVVKRNQEQNK